MNIYRPQEIFLLDFENGESNLDKYVSIEDYEQLQKQNKRLREYASHKPICQSKNGLKCNCGYNELLKGGER